MCNDHNRSEGFPNGIFHPCALAYGLGLLPDGRVVGASSPSASCLETQVDILAGELYLEFFIWIWGRGERYLRMETGVLHRISIQIL